LQDVYAALGEDELGVRQKVSQALSPVEGRGGPAGLRWYAPLTVDVRELAVWARQCAESFICKAKLSPAHREALLGWRGFVELLPHPDLRARTSRGPVRAISSLQQLLDEDVGVISRLAGPPVQEAFEALKRRQFLKEEEAKAEAQAKAREAQLEREEEEGIESLMAQARAQLENLRRREALEKILKPYEAEIGAAKALLSAKREEAEVSAKEAAAANKKLLASAGIGKVREALRAGNEALAVAWAAYAGAKTERRLSGSLETLMRLDTRLQSEAVAPSAMDKALLGDGRNLLDQEVRDAALVEFAGLSVEASTIPAMREVGKSVPGFIAPARGAKKAKVESALNWFARLHQELVEADL